MSLHINPAGQPPGLYWEASFQGQPVFTPITAGWFVSYLDANTLAPSIGQMSLLYREQEIVVVRPLNASALDTAQWLRIGFAQVQSAGYRLLKLSNQAVVGTGTRTVSLVARGDLIGAIKRQEGWLPVAREHPLTRAWSLQSAEQTTFPTP
jgi:hypothetical protein